MFFFFGQTGIFLSFSFSFFDKDISYVEQLKCHVTTNPRFLSSFIYIYIYIYFFFSHKKFFEIFF
jgi:hypothetical protein